MRIGSTLWAQVRRSRTRSRPLAARAAATSGSRSTASRWRRISAPRRAGSGGRTPCIPRGATFDGAETSFTVYARHADAVELCAAARGTLTVEARSVVVLSRPAARP